MNDLSCHIYICINPHIYIYMYFRDIRYECFRSIGNDHTLIRAADRIMGLSWIGAY